MPGFLRKKSTKTQQSNQPPVILPTIPSTSSPPTTPLYSKFASNTPNVSGPMALGSRRQQDSTSPPTRHGSHTQPRHGARLVQGPPSSFSNKPLPQADPFASHYIPPTSTPRQDPLSIPKRRESLNTPASPANVPASLPQPRRISLQQQPGHRLGDAIAPRRVESDSIPRPSSKVDPVPAKTIPSSPPQQQQRLSQSIRSSISEHDPSVSYPSIHGHLLRKRDPSQPTTTYSPSTQPQPINGHDPAYLQQNQTRYQANVLPSPPPSSPPTISANMSRTPSVKPGRGPLIFAAMAGSQQDEDATPRPQPPAMDYWETYQRGPYPSPPQEHMRMPPMSPPSPPRRELPKPPSPPAQQPYPSTPRRAKTPDLPPSQPVLPVTPDLSPRHTPGVAPRVRKDSRGSRRDSQVSSARDSYGSVYSQPESMEARQPSPAPKQHQHHQHREHQQQQQQQQRLLTKPRAGTPTSRRSPSPVPSRRDLPKRDQLVSTPQPTMSPALAVSSSQSAELLDSDPFAKSEGVVVYGANGETQSRPSSGPKTEEAGSRAVSPESSAHHHHHQATTTAAAAVRPSTPVKVAKPPSPDQSPSKKKRREKDDKRDSRHRTKSDPPKAENEKPPEPFPLKKFVLQPNLLGALLPYLSFWDWCNLSAVNKKLRHRLFTIPELREQVLERYLWTVGYSRWTWGGHEALPISIQNLHDYMRGVSMPTYQYAQLAQSYLNAQAAGSLEGEEGLRELAAALEAGTRAYTRLVCRVRAQVEAEQALENQRIMRSKTSATNSSSPPVTQMRGISSRPSSPTRSIFSSGHSAHGHGSSTPANRSETQIAPPRPMSPVYRSPLYRPRRAPLLRVFVPSPDGDWLSDASVLQCEAELKSSVDNMLSMLRVGDVVWDLAVGDEGNVGRMIWDGCYLIDLDYTFSNMGDLPKYIHTLAFPPSYFHRVIRSGPSTSNPIAHIDITPWGEEIAANLQLLQDRIRTETPQGSYHNVVRWVHRSSFQVRPTRMSPRIPIPGVPGAFVDPGWYGTVVVETEGTNEHLADLQARCGPAAFPGRQWKPHEAKKQELKNTYRILREKSRPGEIWIRTVSEKEIKI